MVTTPTTPTTLLEAVNLLLLAIRVDEVMSLDTEDLRQDATAALTAVNHASRTIQIKGWEFNTNYDLVIDPDENGEIVLPSNCLFVRKARSESGVRLVERNRKLYDNINNTFNIGAAVKCELVVGLPYEELSEAFRLWVVAQAAWSFCTSKLPSGFVSMWTKEFLDEARQQALDQEAAVVDEDLQLTSPHFERMRRR